MSERVWPPADDFPWPEAVRLPGLGVCACCDSGPEEPCDHERPPRFESISLAALPRTDRLFDGIHGSLFQGFIKQSGYGSHDLHLFYEHVPVSLIRTLDRYARSFAENIENALGLLYFEPVRTATHVVTHLLTVPHLITDDGVIPVRFLGGEPVVTLRAIAGFRKAP